MKPVPLLHAAIVLPGLAIPLTAALLAARQAQLGQLQVVRPVTVDLPLDDDHRDDQSLLWNRKPSSATTTGTTAWPGTGVATWTGYPPTVSVGSSVTSR